MPNRDKTMYYIVSNVRYILYMYNRAHVLCCSLCVCVKEASEA